MHPVARASLERLPELAGGPALLAASDRISGIWLVGGAVRDTLLGAPVRDLDVAVEGDAMALAAALGDVVESHERFGTAEVLVADGGKVNVAATREESYAAPGALPDVRPAGIDADLARRDFTINAIAVGLSAAVRGEVRSAPHALADAETRLLRVLHNASFADDPTRLLRLARYATRLGLGVEEHTAELAALASREGLLGRTVSGERVGREVRLALGEPDPLRTLQAAAAALAGTLPEPDSQVARAALALLPEDGRADVLILASGAIESPGALGESLRRLGFPAGDVRRAELAAGARALATALSSAARPSEIAAAAAGRPPEAVALAGALGPRDGARTWLDDLRHVRLAIDGRDLIAAGVPEGPEVGARLRRALAALLDGEVSPGRDAELAAALAG